MERESARGASPGQPFSGLLQQLARPGTAGAERAAGDAALRELGALLEAADWPALLREDPGVAPALGQVARALCGQAAPAQAEEAPRVGAERAARVGAVFVQLLRGLEAARGSLGPAAVTAALRPAAPYIYIFSVTHRQERPWSSPASQRAAQEALAALLRVTGCGSVSEFLRGETADRGGRFPAVMGLLGPELTKDLHRMEGRKHELKALASEEQQMTFKREETNLKERESWKNNPATKYIFSWTLYQVTRPWLSQHLERILPPSLLISDDYQNENKILGVHCLHHIVLNVPAADLRQFNRAQVLYHALFNHLYTPEPDLIQAVLECLLDLFPVLERPLQWKATEPRSSGPCDDVLQLILTHMEPEYRLLLRRTYARNLSAFIERLGILTVRHLKRLEQVIIGYLEVYDGPEEEARLRILEALKLTIKHCWPRIPCRLEIFLKALLKMVCDVAKDQSLTPEPVKAALLQEATDCLTLLDHCSAGQVTSLLTKAVQSCKDDKVLDCIRKVQELSGRTTKAGT